jgi:hypothetical protein
MSEWRLGWGAQSHACTVPIFNPAMPARSRIACFPSASPRDGPRLLRRIPAHRRTGRGFLRFRLAGGSSLLLTIGDASEKGVPAAIVVAGVSSSLRALGVSSCDRISDLMQDVNRVICEVSPNKFYATMLHACIDVPRARTGLRQCRARSCHTTLGRLKACYRA